MIALKEAAVTEPTPPRLYPEHVIRYSLKRHPFDGRGCGCKVDLSGYTGGSAYRRWTNHLVHRMMEHWKEVYQPEREVPHADRAD